MKIADKNKCRRCVFTAVILVLSVLLLAALWPIITPFLLACALAYLLAPQIQKMSTLGIPLALSLTVVILYLLLALYVLLVMTLPILLEQLRNLVAYMPDFLEMISAAGSDFMNSLPDNQISAHLQEGLSGLGTIIEEKFAESSKNLANVVIGIPEAVVYIILAPILAYYLLRDKEKIRNSIMSLVAPLRQKEFLRLTGELNDLIRGFVSGYLFVAVIMGALSTVFYYAVGIDYAFALGILMGITDLIPYFGPILGAVPAVLVAFADSGTKAIIIIIGLLVLQQLESSVITPRVMGNRVGLHPVVTIFVVLAGGYLAGLVGAILAVPVAAVLLLIIKYVFSSVFADNQLRNPTLCDKIQK